jgi:glycosyltransferase involved in cell wall biosynthesis
LAMPGGSVQEIVRNGTSGYICRSVREMTKRLGELNFDPVAIRAYVEENFSIERMVTAYLNLYRVAQSEAQQAA